MSRVISVATALFLMSLVLQLSSCNPCETAVRSSVQSPDQRLVATFYERDCAATTDFSSIVNVLNKQQKFDADDSIVFIAKGRYDISLEWRSPTELMIRCSNCLRKNIFREVTVLGSIDLSYNIGPASSK